MALCVLVADLAASPLSGRLAWPAVFGAGMLAGGLIVVTVSWLATRTRGPRARARTPAHGPVRAQRAARAAPPVRAAPAWADRTLLARPAQAPRRPQTVAHPPSLRIGVLGSLTVN